MEAATREQNDRMSTSCSQAGGEAFVPILTEDDFELILGLLAEHALLHNMNSLIDLLRKRYQVDVLYSEHVAQRDLLLLMASTRALLEVGPLQDFTNPIFLHTLVSSVTQYCTKYPEAMAEVGKPTIAILQEFLYFFITSAVLKSTQFTDKEVHNLMERYFPVIRPTGPCRAWAKRRPFFHFPNDESRPVDDEIKIREDLAQFHRRARKYIQDRINQRDQLNSISSDSNILKVWEDALKACIISLRDHLVKKCAPSRLESLSTGRSEAADWVVRHAGGKGRTEKELVEFASYLQDVKVESDFFLSLDDNME